MADDSEQPTQIISGPPQPPRGGTATLEPHEPRLDEGGPGGTYPPQPPTGYGGGGGGDEWGDDDGGDGGDKRIAILAAIIGILVVIVLFLLLKPGSKDDETPVTTSPVATATATPAPTDEATPTPTPQATGSATPTPTPAATDVPNGGATVGGSVPTLEDGSVTKFTVSQNDTVQFNVKNSTDQTQEVHVHGYDKAYNVPAGATQLISFKATITGIFEIEFEATSTQIGELTVEP